MARMAQTEFMIVYDLICSQGHHFEGWFNNLQDLEKQLEQQLLSCPVCGDEQIARRPSTFGLVKSAKTETVAKQGPNNGEAGVDPRHIQEIMNRWAEISAKLEKDFDDVGANFADEALKMHYGAADRRNIRGMSTADQEDMLKKEGVDFFKVPLLSRKNPSSAGNN